mmetsp:Transcript_12187/g.15984  ORF Transcript_12187/g.15984 Transcript_12187/m.15984 type:complete len:513 (-) Transcript_12187:47-1585(-)
MIFMNPSNFYSILSKFLFFLGLHFFFFSSNASNTMTAFMKPFFENFGTVSNKLSFRINRKLSCRQNFETNLLMTILDKSSSQQISQDGSFLCPEQGFSEFYEKLGRPKYIAAPMVQQSELAFRMLCRRYKTDLAFTQMLHSKHFSDPHAHSFRAENFDGLGPEESIDRPLIAQFCGNEPTTVLKAAQYIEHQVDAVDLNFGCPQGIAKKGHYGAYLLSEPDLCEAMVKILADNLSCATTVKMRCLPTLEETIAFAQKMEAAGAQMLTLHGRTLKQSKTNAGAANWDNIRAVKQNLKIPVIANGGIEHFGDVQKCLAYTGADGVMSSEALLENPMLFDEQKSSPDILASLSAKDIAHRQLGVTFEYLSLVMQYPTHYGAFKSHVFKFLHRLFEVQTDLRAVFGSKKTALYEDMIAIIFEMAKRYNFSSPLEDEILHALSSSGNDLNRHQKKYRQRIVAQDGRQFLNNDKDVSSQLQNRESYAISTNSWYRRHWNLKHGTNHDAISCHTAGAAA